MLSLELHNISKSFDERDVFTGINVVTGSGCLVVTGRNGSGKSTLLKIIAGLLEPTAGEITIEAGKRMERRDLIGFAAPDLSLYGELSALENLKFFARVRGLKKSDDDLRAMLTTLGLAGREDDRLGSYSSGMLQRVKFGAALLHDPLVLLLDEPFSNLDDDGSAVVDAIIGDWKTRGIVVLATNNQSERHYGDQVLELGK